MAEDVTGAGRSYGPLPTLRTGRPHAAGAAGIIMADTNR
jgi:hypothetical protein